MKKVIAIFVLLFAASLASAQPYVAVSFASTQEVAVGYSTKWLDLEIGAMTDYQIAYVNQITRVDEWSVHGNRLTAKFKAPLAKINTTPVELVAGLSIYDVTYKYESSHAATEKMKELTWGGSLGVKFTPFEERFSLLWEWIYIKTPDKVGLSDVGTFRVGVSYSF